MVVINSQNNQFQCALSDRRWELLRYPEDRSGNLRAWDTADRYLLETVEPLIPSINNLMIVHDNFGALSLPLLGFNPIVYGDSWMAREALIRNVRANGAVSDVHFVTDLRDLSLNGVEPDCVIGRVPKSKNQLKYLLQTLNRLVSDDCVLLLAGMDKHLSKGQYDLLERYFGEASFLPGVKKARVWKAVVNKQIVSVPKKAKSVDIPEFELALSALPNVFSQDKLDIGTRFFLSQLKQVPSCEKVVDLACGNGALGLAYMRLHHHAEMTFCDESYQAIQSAEDNLNQHFQHRKAAFVAGDGLKSFDSDSQELILCNPPFHQNHAIGTDIALSFFKDAKRVLKSGGELWIVANRHLGYHASLKKIFGSFINAASNPKFVVLKAVKT